MNSSTLLADLCTIGDKEWNQDAINIDAWYLMPDICWPNFRKWRIWCTEIFVLNTMCIVLNDIHKVKCGESCNLWDSIIYQTRTSCIGIESYSWLEYSKTGHIILFAFKIFEYNHWSNRQKKFSLYIIKISCKSVKCLEGRTGML